MNTKILSIIIPTYNRATILPYTLSLFKEQIERNKESVELIICDNASTDNTLKTLQDIAQKDTFFSVVNYVNHVEVGVSILRSLKDNSRGEYTLLWGDDDVPAPMFVDVVVAMLQKYPDIDALVYNRLEGDTYCNDITINALNVTNDSFNSYEKYYTDSKKFLEDHYREMGFLSVSIIRTKSVLEQEAYFNNENLGYEFLAPYCLAFKDKPTLYIDFPLCVQRHAWGESGKNKWLNKYPLFVYVGHPRVLRMLQENGAIDNWQDIYQKMYFQKSEEHYYRCLFGTIYDQRDMYLPYVDEICSYQSDKVRIKQTKLLLMSNSSIRRCLLIRYKIRKEGIRYILSLPLKLYNRISHKLKFC